MLPSAFDTFLKVGALGSSVTQIPPNDGPLIVRGSSSRANANETDSGFRCPGTRESEVDSSIARYGQYDRVHDVRGFGTNP